MFLRPLPDDEDDQSEEDWVAANFAYLWERLGEAIGAATPAELPALVRECRELLKDFHYL